MPRSNSLNWREIPLDPQELARRFAEAPHDDDDDAEARADERERYAAMWDDPAFKAALGQLPQVEYAALELSVAGVSYKNIGQLLDVSLSKARFRIGRAKIRLRFLLTHKAPSLEQVNAALDEIDVRPSTRRVVLAYLRTSSLTAAGLECALTRDVARRRIWRGCNALEAGSPNAQEVGRYLRVLPPLLLSPAKRSSGVSINPEGTRATNPTMQALLMDPADLDGQVDATGRDVLELLVAGSGKVVERLADGPPAETQPDIDYARLWNDEAFKAAFALLPAIERDVLELSAAGKNRTDIGRLLGVSHASVTWRLRQAARRLQFLLTHGRPSSKQVTAALDEIGASGSAKRIVRAFLKCSSANGTAAQVGCSGANVEYHLGRVCSRLAAGSENARSLSRYMRAMPRQILSHRRWRKPNQVPNPVHTTESLRQSERERFSPEAPTVTPATIPPLAPETTQ